MAKYLLNTKPAPNPRNPDQKKLVHRAAGCADSQEPDLDGKCTEERGWISLGEHINIHRAESLARVLVAGAPVRVCNTCGGHK